MPKYQVLHLVFLKAIYFPNSEKDVNVAIQTIKENDRLSHIKAAYDKLEKTNKTHVVKFIERYENDSDASVYVEKARECLTKESDDEGKTITDLASVVDAKQFKAVLDDLNSISKDDQEIIKENIIRRIQNEENKR